MTKREEVRLECIDRAIAFYKAQTGEAPYMMKEDEVLDLAKKFERYVDGSDK